jgi:pyruvate kinase
MSRRRTKIIATLGPATDDETVLRQLIDAGVDVFRINLSHGSREEQLARANQLRAVSGLAGREVGMLADLKGPKIRVESFADSPVTLENGASFTLDADEDIRPGDESRVNVSYAGLPGDVSPGQVLLLDDGLISMEVVGVSGSEIHCRVINGGQLGDRKGLNLKGGGLSVPGLSGEDIDDISHAIEMGIDFLAVSFPRNARDMQRARKLLREGGSEAVLFAKIERVEAIANLEEIIDASDAVMVARGDLGVEIGDAQLPGLQKKIISKALNQNRVAVTATQMMQSMVEHPIPTRAEVLDVANAVIDGTDAVMLSAETAVGKYPLKVVEAMQEICIGAERHCAELTSHQKLNVRFQRIDQAIAMAAMFTAANVSVQAIVALTESGSTARWLSRVSTSVPIFALSPNPASRRRMALYRNVYPVDHSSTLGISSAEITSEAIHNLFQKDLLKNGDRVIFTMGEQMGSQGGTNMMKIIQVGADGKSEHQMDFDYD